MVFEVRRPAFGTNAPTRRVAVNVATSFAVKYYVCQKQTEIVCHAARARRPQTRFSKEKEDRSPRVNRVRLGSSCGAESQPACFGGTAWPQRRFCLTGLFESERAVGEHHAVRPCGSVVTNLAQKHADAGHGHDEWLRRDCPDALKHLVDRKTWLQGR